MNYHLEQLEGFVEKNQQNRYVLTPLGKKAVNQLKQLKGQLSIEDEKYLKIAEKSQRTSLEPIVKAFLIIGIAVCLVVTVLLAGFAFVLLTQGAFPTTMLFVFVPGVAIEVGLAATLVYALRKAPAWVRKLERRFLSTV